MTQSRFCAQCGASTPADAAFCPGCGTARRQKGAAPARAPWLERYAAALILVLVLCVAGSAIGIGILRQPPTNTAIPAPGPAVDSAAALPQGHPTIGIPDDVLKVIERMEKLAAEQPDNIETWKQVAFVQYRAGQVSPEFLRKAEESYEQVLRLDSRDLDALRGLGNIAYDRNDSATALRRYQEFLAVKPDDKGVLTDLGTMLLAAKRTDEAIATYQRVLQQDTRFFQAQFNLAIAYRAAGQTDLALAALQRSREVADSDEARQQVDAVLQQLQAASEGSPASAGGPKETIEAVFRSHPIVGPRLERVDWQNEQHARVILRDFPMDGMPPMVREKFDARIRSGIRDGKQRLKIDAPFEIEIVDSASGRIMATVVE